MNAIQLNNTPAFFAKAFRTEDGVAIATAIVAVFAGDLSGRRVVVIDHPPTAGLKPLLEGLINAGAEVHLRDHHADADRDGQVVVACRALLGDRAIVMTRSEHPACATLVQVGEFAGDIIVADADQDGITAALKAAGIHYDGLEADAAVLDGPATGKTEGSLTPLGWALVRAFGAISAFGDRNRDAVFTQVVEAFASAAKGEALGFKELDRLAIEFERKVASARALATSATIPFVGFRFLEEVPAGAEFDAPTLAIELDRGVLVSGRQVATGPIAKSFGAQVSLARTKAGEDVVDLAKLAEEVFGTRPETGWKPEDGVISNTPFLLHLSPENWIKFQPVLKSALA
jgi:hypothetical protein